jgi:hypothetical protein
MAGMRLSTTNLRSVKGAQQGMGRTRQRNRKFIMENGNGKRKGCFPQNKESAKKILTWHFYCATSLVR